MIHNNALHSTFYRNLLTNTMSTLLVLRSQNHNNPKQKKKVQVSHCGYMRNTVDGFYKIHGYPPDFNISIRMLQASLRLKISLLLWCFLRSQWLLVSLWTILNHHLVVRRVLDQSVLLTWLEEWLRFKFKMWLLSAAHNCKFPQLHNEVAKDIMG